MLVAVTGRDPSMDGDEIAHHAKVVRRLISHYNGFCTRAVCFLPRQTSFVLLCKADKTCSPPESLLWLQLFEEDRAGTFSLSGMADRALDKAGDDEASTPVTDDPMWHLMHKVVVPERALGSMSGLHVQDPARQRLIQRKIDEILAAGALRGDQPPAPQMPHLMKDLRGLLNPGPGESSYTSTHRLWPQR